jgi:hypothetical protein
MHRSGVRCASQATVWRIHLALAALAVAGCHRELDVALTQQIAAQRLAADMRVQLHRSAEAVQRAIMADTDETSADFVREAQEATAALEEDYRSIEPIVGKIGSGEEVRLAQEFGNSLGRLKDLDRTLLALAVENTNVKAQRISFGPAREAAAALRDHLELAVRSAAPVLVVRAELLATRVQLGVREIQALQAPHIAEADDAVMTELEKQMARSEATARASLAELSQLLGPDATELVAAQRDLLALSRENSDVRSLAVALGDKRTATAACDSSLIALQGELAKHGFQATR